MCKKQDNSFSRASCLNKRASYRNKEEERYRYYANSENNKTTCLKNSKEYIKNKFLNFLKLIILLISY